MTGIWFLIQAVVTCGQYQEPQNFDKSAKVVFLNFVDFMNIIWLRAFVAKRPVLFMASLMQTLFSHKCMLLGNCKCVFFLISKSEYNAFFCVLSNTVLSGGAHRPFRLLQEKHTAISVYFFLRIYDVNCNDDFISCTSFFVPVLTTFTSTWIRKPMANGIDINILFIYYKKTPFVWLCARAFCQR